jgi:hypothetical protein
MVVLLQNGADINAMDDYWCLKPLSVAVAESQYACVLQLLCFGAEMDEMDKEAIEIYDDLKLLQQINDNLESLRAGNGMKSTLMVDEERRFMWNLAFSFTIKYRVAAFKAYYAIRSFITYNGIFMGPGFDVGAESIWRKKNMVSGRRNDG